MDKIAQLCNDAHVMQITSDHFDTPFKLTREDLEAMIDDMSKRVEGNTEKVILCPKTQGHVSAGLLERLETASTRIRRPIVIISTPSGADNLFAKCLGAAEMPLTFGARRPGKPFRIWDGLATKALVNDIVKYPEGFTKEYDAVFTRVGPQPDLVIFDEASKWDDAMFQRWRDKMDPEEYRRQYQCDFLPTPIVEEYPDKPTKKGPNKPYFRQDRY